MKTIGAYEAKTHLARVLREVATKGEEYVIERRGRKLAKIVPCNDFKPGPRVTTEEDINGDRPWATLRVKDEQDKLYEAAYQREPETLPDVRDGMKAGLALWKKEKW